MPKFPDDFTTSAHHAVPGATQWRLADSKGKTIISVVGGGNGIYGNGVTTFEMYDFREDSPQGYLSRGEINEHLILHPLD